MTQAKCTNVVAALVTNGYQPTVYKDGTGGYHVKVTTDGPIDAQVVVSFATSQGITANVTQVDLV